MNIIFLLTYTLIFSCEGMEKDAFVSGTLHIHQKDIAPIVNEIHGKYTRPKKWDSECDLKTFYFDLKRKSK